MKITMSECRRSDFDVFSNTQTCLLFWKIKGDLTFSVPRFFSRGRFSLTWRSTRIFCQYLCSWSPLKHVPPALYQWNLKKHTEGDDEGAAHLTESPTSSWTPSAAPLWHRSPLWFPLEYESGCVPRHLLPGCRCTPPGTVWTELPVWNEDINANSLLFEWLHYTGPLINLRFSFESSELCFNYELLIANTEMLTQW